MFGKLLALPVRIINVPATALEKILDADERSISKPLESVAEAIEEAADGDTEG